MAQQKEQISIAQMLQNPTGKRSAYFASRARVKSQLDFIFIKNLRKYRREFYAVPYIDDTTRNIFFYVAVPSETFQINKVRWDCVIEIEYDGSKMLEHRNARFYTNSPSFIFTYAYVFNQRGLLPDIVKQKMPIQSLTQAPNVTNNAGVLGFDKILYQALKYLTVGGCLTDSYIDRYKQRWNVITQSQLLARIANTDKLVSIYQHAKRLQSLKRHTNRKPLNSKQKHDISKEARGYDKFRKASTPTYLGTIFKKAPRSKITARRAQKIIGKRKPKQAIKTSY